MNQKYEPKALENQPYIPSHLSEYVRAFSLLSTRRQTGFDSTNPISMTDILAWANDKIFRASDPEKFVMYMVMMDAALVKCIRSKAENKPVIGPKSG